MIEEWRLCECPHLMVSNFGMVKKLYSRYAKGVGVAYPGRRDLHGYFFVSRSPKRSSRTIPVHVLVAKVFLGEPPSDGSKYEINHKDGNKGNNVASNLEWVTRAQNIAHARNVLGRTVGINIRPVLCLNNKTWYPTQREAAKALGISYQNVNNNLRGRSKATREGHRFEFL